MSYLKFRPLNFVSRDEFEGTIFAWPVLAVPVRYWAAVPSALDILEKALLALLNTGLRQPAELQQLLGIPPSMDNMIERALRQLQARNYVNDRLYLTEQGSQALVDDETVTREFRQGWLLFDQVQGGVFPYIHSGHLPFFRADMAAKFPMIKIPTQAFLPPEQELRQMGAAALVAYNRSIVLLAAIEDDAENRRPSDLDRDLDLLVELPELASFERGRIDDIELLPMVLYEDHHLLVEVVGELLPGSTRVCLQAYSPFSNWEQARYLDTLSQLEIPQVKQGLAELDKRIRQAADTGVWSHFKGLEGDVHVSLTRKIKEELGGQIALPELLVEELLSCEYLYQVYERQDVTDQPFGRSAALNRWGLLLETILTHIALEIKGFVVPTDWHKDFNNHKKAWSWYQDIVNARGLSQHWLSLPDHFLSRIFRNSRKPVTFGEIRTSSSPDILVQIILAGFSTTITESTPRTYNLLTTIERGQFQFKDFAETADWRNKASHTYGIQPINQLTDTEYLERLSMMRTTNYSILKQIFTQ